MADSFRRDSYRNPHGIPSDSGYGYGKGRTEGSLRETNPVSGRPTGFRDDSVRRTEAEQRSSERRANDRAWAEANLPDREMPLVVSAYSMLRWRLKREPSVAEVEKRLDSEYGERSFKRFYEERG